MTENLKAVPIGTASLANIVANNVPAPTDEEVVAAIESNNKAFQTMAREKLEEELKKAKEKSFAEPIIEHLLKRCAEDTGLAEDVCQAHKTWEKCFDFIYASARKMSKGNRQCAVRNEVVFEWAEDYYHKDDKAEAEEERKAKEKIQTAKKKGKNVKTEKTKPDKGFEDSEVKKSKAEPKEKTKEDAAGMETTASEKIKKNNRDMEGQMDLFSLMGL